MYLSILTYITVVDETIFARLEVDDEHHDSSSSTCCWRYCQELPVSLCWMSMTGNLDGSLAGEMESSNGTTVSRMSCRFVVTTAMANACTATAKLVMVRLTGGIDHAQSKYKCLLCHLQQW